MVLLNESTFLDQTFQVFKSNGSIPLQDDDEKKFDEFLDNFAQFIFKYLNRVNPLILNSSNDLIASVSSYNEILRDLITSHGSTLQQKNYEITYFSIRHPNTRILPPQTIIFIKRKEDEGGEIDGKVFNTLVLVKSSNPSICEALLRIVECMELPYPLIIKPGKISEDFLKNTINKMGASSTRMDTSKAFGDIEFTFQTSNIVGENLRNITILVPEKDLSKLVKIRTKARSQIDTEHDVETQGDPEKAKDDAYPLVDVIFTHLKSVTSLNFHYLSLARFISRIVNISQDGKIKIHRSILNYDLTTSEDQDHSLVWNLLISLYNEK